MMEFVIVLIFCVVLVIAVMVIGSGMGKATSSQRQMDIINVAQNLYVLIRKGDLKKCDVTQTTAFLLNIAKSTVLKYYKKDIEEVSTPGKKRKKRPQEGKSLDTVDDFTVNAIRNAIYRMYAEGQKTADYHGEMNGETFLMWFEDMLVHLEEPSVIIMDNASYHSTQVEKTPTTNWTKDALIAWLEKNEIKHENNLLKVELLRIAKQNKPRIRWARCVDHVEKLIQADWEREVHIDSGTIPPLIIHLGKDSSSEDSDSEEFEVTTQQVDGDSEVLAVPLDDLPGCSY
ncbi:uncharacterized protein LOC134534906 isoform X2 [Bacillus rossius redtenbacheri]|uniref:uncharacterized protein LOC134534906 isoform X2 n=1 Tax=Bacillus rossius redtenbacheri TaxID=93214 RepID=UPI002FDE4EB8